MRVIIETFDDGSVFVMTTSQHGVMEYKAIATASSPDEILAYAEMFDAVGRKLYTIAAEAAQDETGILQGGYDEESS